MYVDLTMEISERTPTLPGGKPAEITAVATFDADGWRGRRITVDSHFGTHIDAPYHMRRDGKRLEDYPLDTFIGETAVIDVRGVPVVGAEHLTDTKGCPRVFLRTGHSDRAFADGYFTDNPVVGLDAAEELVRRGVRLLGVDSFTPDNAPYATHQTLFAHDVLVVENLVGLDRLPPFCDVVVAPLNLRDADGGPVRVVARV